MIAAVLERKVPGIGGHWGGASPKRLIQIDVWKRQHGVVDVRATNDQRCGYAAVRKDVSEKRTSRAGPGAMDRRRRAARSPTAHTSLRAGVGGRRKKSRPGMCVHAWWMAGWDAGVRLGALGHWGRATGDAAASAERCP